MLWSVVLCADFLGNGVQCVVGLWALGLGMEGDGRLGEEGDCSLIAGSVKGGDGVLVFGWRRLGDGSGVDIISAWRNAHLLLPYTLIRMNSRIARGSLCREWNQYRLTREPFLQDEI